MVDWSNLPADLLDPITARLALHDLIRFSCVCTSWRSSSPPSICRINQHLPWIIVPYQEKGTPETKKTTVHNGTLGFFDLLDQKVYRVELPEISGARICGFSAGWLVTIHKESKVQLVHPFSKKVQLLPTLTVSEVRSLLKSYYYFRHGNYLKLITSTGPNPTFVALLKSSRQLAFCRVGNDEKWIRIDSRLGICRDVAFYKGELYGINEKGDVFVIRGLNMGSPSPYVLERISSHSTSAYLVKSAGELLAVITLNPKLDSSLDRNDAKCVRPKILRFKVFKIDVSGTNSAVEIDSLGNQALFLSHNSSFSISISDFPDLKRNCIYFIDGVDVKHFYGKPFNGPDIGVFSLDNGNTEPWYPGDSELAMPAPIWFLANPH